MTETSYFFDSVSYTEAAQADFQAHALRPQGVFLESILGSLLVTAPSGNMTVTVGSGEAMVQGFYYRNDANKVLAIASNSSGATRIDSVVLRLNRSANTLTAMIVQGIPGAGVPTLTQNAGGNWDFLLCNVTVNNGAASIIPANLLDQRAYSMWPQNAINIAGEVSERMAADASLYLYNGITGWVYMNVSNVILSKSPNVLSVTKAGTGLYNVNLNASYTYITGVGSTWAWGVPLIVDAGVGGSTYSLPTTVQFRVRDTAGNNADANVALLFKGIP